MNVIPVQMSVMEWAEAMILPLSSKIVCPRLLNGDQWRDWGNKLIQFPAIAAYNPPQPEKFNDWREWAYQFNQTVVL
jgi:hypothetical protein